MFESKYTIQYCVFCEREQQGKKVSSFFDMHKTIFTNLWAIAFVGGKEKI